MIFTVSTYCILIYQQELHENMKCVMPESLLLKCDNFVRNFSALNITNDITNAVHDKTWKENISTLEKRAERILSVL